MLPKNKYKAIHNRNTNAPQKTHTKQYKRQLLRFLDIYIIIGDVFWGNPSVRIKRCGRPSERYPEDWSMAITRSVKQPTLLSLILWSPSYQHQSKNLNECLRKQQFKIAGFLSRKTYKRDYSYKNWKRKKKMACFSRWMVKFVSKSEHFAKNISQNFKDKNCISPQNMTCVF